MPTTLYGKPHIPLTGLMVGGVCNHPGCRERPTRRTFLLGIPFCERHFIEFYSDADTYFEMQRKQG